MSNDFDLRRFPPNLRLHAVFFVFEDKKCCGIFCDHVSSVGAKMQHFQMKMLAVSGKALQGFATFWLEHIATQNTFRQEVEQRFRLVCVVNRPAVKKTDVPHGAYSAKIFY